MLAVGDCVIVIEAFSNTEARDQLYQAVSAIEGTRHVGATAALRYTQVTCYRIDDNYEKLKFLLNSVFVVSSFPPIKRNAKHGNWNGA